MICPQTFFGGHRKSGGGSHLICGGLGSKIYSDGSRQNIFLSQDDLEAVSSGFCFPTGGGCKQKANFLPPVCPEEMKAKGEIFIKLKYFRRF